MGSRTEAAASRRLAGFLARTRRRLLARRVFEGAWSALPWCLAGAALALLLARVAQLLGLLSWDRRDLLPAIAALVALGLLSAALVAARRRFGEPEVALVADRRLETNEALATAAWLSGAPDGEARAERALERLGDRGPADAVPWRAPPWRGALVGAAALLAAALAPLPGLAEGEPPPVPDPQVQATARAVEEGAQRIAEALEERSPPESVESLLEEVVREARALQDAPVDPEEARLSLQRLDQRVGEERDRREAGDSGALERALSSLEQAALTRRAARAATLGDAQALESELAALSRAFREGTSFERREVDRLSVRLSEAAAELRESSHGELADALDEIARALAEGDLERAAELFEQLAESGALHQAANDAAADRALEQTQALLQQALAQVGRARPDQLGEDGLVSAARALREAARALDEAEVPQPAAALREIAASLEASELEAAATSMEELLASGELREKTGSAEGDAAAREAERLVAEALAAVRDRAAGGAGGGGGQAWRGQRGRTGAPQIPRDWGVGSTNEAAASFELGAPGHQSDRQSDETSDWVEAYEALYESTRLDDARGRATRVRGQVGEGEHVAVPVWTTAEGPGPAQRPLVRLPPSYARAGEEAIARETVPAGYAESVRRYFESLGAGTAEPPKGEDP